MGEAERLIQLFENLPDEDRGEIIHLVEFLARKAGSKMLTPSEDRSWLDEAARDRADALSAIEAEINPAKLESWLKSVEAVVKPARYVPGKGLVVGG